MSCRNRTNKEANRTAPKFRLAAHLVLATSVVAAGAWLLPVRAQETTAPQTPAATTSAAPANAPTSPVQPGEHGTNEGLQEHGPGGQHAPEGGTHEAGGEHGAKGGHEEEEGFSIHLPSWIYGPLKKFWFSGPATLSADGAVTPAGEAVAAAELQGQKVDFTYVDHHSHISPKPEYQIHPVIGTIGTRTSGNGEPTPVTVNGREVLLIEPSVHFAYESMFPELLVISLLTALTIAIVTFLMTRNLQRVPDRKQAFLELIYVSLDNFVHGLIGDHYKRYVPLVGTIFIYVLIMNLAGLIPGWASPTANINVPAGLAIVVVLYVQIEGIRVNGLKGYLMHFVGDPWWLGPLNFPIHAIGEVARVLSLTIRLFGNIFGEDVVIVILIALAGMFTKGLVPFQAPMYLLAIFTSFVQAMVFSILTCVYIALMTTHEDHGHGHGEHGHGHDEEHGVYHDGHAPAPAI